MDAAFEEQPECASGGSEDLSEAAAHELLQQHGFLTPLFSSDIIELPAAHGGGHVFKLALVAELKCLRPGQRLPLDRLVKSKAQAAASCDPHHQLKKLHSHLHLASEYNQRLDSIVGTCGSV